MPRTEIYFKSWCPYCVRALRVLDAKGVNYEAIDLTNSADAEVQRKELEMRERAGRTSVPQIFIDDRHIGGYDDIAALDNAGQLDPLLFDSRKHAA
jgi:glutaredoxin 3